MRGDRSVRACGGAPFAIALVATTLTVASAGVIVHRHRARNQRRHRRDLLPCATVVLEGESPISVEVAVTHTCGTGSNNPIRLVVIAAAILALGAALALSSQRGRTRRTGHPPTAQPALQQSIG
ncbi:MAG: hypothetical protein AAGA42_05420 [Actinomycetota bacterium]